MNKRDKERLERERAKIEANSRNRMKWVRSKKDSELNLDIPAKDMSFPELPGPKPKKELHWRKYKNTRRARPFKRRKRISVVETIHKGKEVYIVGGLNSKELERVIEVLR